MPQHDTENKIEVRAAVALRAARTGLGWSQEIAAEKAGLSKTTIARIETLAGQVSLGNIFRLIETYAEHGVDIADLKLRTVQITFEDPALLEASLSLFDPERKRSDNGRRRKPRQKPAEGATGGGDSSL